MIKKLIVLVLFIILLFSLISFVKSQTVIVQPLDDRGQIFPNGQYTYMWNWTTDENCQNVVGSFLFPDLQTNSQGIAAAEMDLSNLVGIPNYVCEYRGGNLREIFPIGDIAIRDIYARNINATNFNGLFNWTVIGDFVSFDGNTLTMNDSLLNDTYINIAGDIVPQSILQLNFTFANASLPFAENVGSFRVKQLNDMGAGSISVHNDIGRSVSLFASGSDFNTSLGLNNAVGLASTGADLLLVVREPGHEIKMQIINSTGNVVDSLVVQSDGDVLMKGDLLLENENKSIRTLPVDGGSALVLQDLDQLDAGGFSFIRQALDPDGNRIITSTDQNGRNNSFSFRMNSFGVLPKNWLLETGMGSDLNDIQFLFNTTDYIKYCSWLQTNLSIIEEGCQYFADTTGRGVPLGFFGDMEVHRSATIHGGLLLFDDFDFVTRTGNDAVFFNGSILNQIPVTFNSGFSEGDEVTIQTDSFEATISPFVNLQSDAGNWRSESNDALCDLGKCAIANGISGDGDIIMQKNFTTSDVNETKISFVYSHLNLIGVNSFEVTANNNVGSGIVSLLTDSGDETLNSQVISLPSSMDDKAVVTINFICDATNVARGCFVDTFKVNGTAISNTSIEVSSNDGEICFKDGLRDINGRCNIGWFYNAETNQMILNGATLNSTLSSAGGLSGTGTANTISMFTASNVLGNSIITQSGTTIVIGGAINSTDWLNVSITESQISDFQSYYLNSNPFGYYNITNFDINDYFTSSQVLGFNYYNATDFDINDYFTSSQVLGFNYYNATDFDINDYYLNSNPLGFYNSTTLIELDPLWDGNSSNVAYINSENIFGAFNQTWDSNTLFIDSNNDKVGIGTSSPSQKLHVEGQANFTGNLTLGQGKCLNWIDGGSLCGV